MKALHLTPYFLCASILAAPTLLSARAPNSVPKTSDDSTSLAVFPPPSGDLLIEIDRDETASLADILARFESLASHNLHISAATRQVLAQVDSGLSNSVSVPAEEVYSYISCLLNNSGFVMAETRSSAPSLLSVFSMDSPERNMVGKHARAIDVEDLVRFERHPALLVQVVIEVQHLDTRFLEKSLRHMVVDRYTQSITSLSPHSLFLMGNSREISAWVHAIRTVDSWELEVAPSIEEAPKGQQNEDEGED
jgi:hypothetical protein